MTVLFLKAYRILYTYTLKLHAGSDVSFVFEQDKRTSLLSDKKSKMSIWLWNASAVFLSHLKTETFSSQHVLNDGALFFQTAFCSSAQTGELSESSFLFLVFQKKDNYYHNKCLHSTLRQCFKGHKPLLSFSERGSLFSIQHQEVELWGFNMAWPDRYPTSSFRGQPLGIWSSENNKYNNMKFLMHQKDHKARELMHASEFAARIYFVWLAEASISWEKALLEKQCRERKK